VHPTRQSLRITPAYLKLLIKLIAIIYLSRYQILQSSQPAIIAIAIVCRLDVVFALELELAVLPSCTVKIVKKRTKRLIFQI
jgi:hypothetical protein